MSIQYLRGRAEGGQRSEGEGKEGEGGRKRGGSRGRKVGRVKTVRYEGKVEEGRAAEDQRELRTWRDSNTWTALSVLLS